MFPTLWVLIKKAFSYRRVVDTEGGGLLGVCLHQQTRTDHGVKRQEGFPENKHT